MNHLLNSLRFLELARKPKSVFSFRVNYFLLFESARQVRSVTLKYLHLRALAQLLDFIVFIVIFSNNSNYTKTHLTLGRDLAELFNCI